MIAEKLLIAGWAGISSIFGIGYAEFNQEINHLAQHTSGKAALVIEETVYANETGRWLANKFNHTTSSNNDIDNNQSWLSALDDVISIPETMQNIDIGTAFTQSYNNPNTPLNISNNGETQPTATNIPSNPWQDSVEALNAVSAALEEAAGR